MQRPANVIIDKKALGEEIEGMEWTVSPEDKDNYLSIIEKYTKDLNSDLSIAESIEMLSTDDCIKLHGDLLELSYEEEEEE